MSVKFASVQCDYDIDIMESVQCLAKLPIPNVSTIDSVSISKVIGSTTEHLWNKFPLTARDVATATREDKVLGKLATAIRTGSINVKDQDLKPFNSVFQDLYLENEVIFHGQRIVIPERQRVRLMDELHTSHIGVRAMKEVSRKQFWWPGINKQIEDMAKACKGCRRYGKKPAPTPLSPWPFALRSLERVHIDFCEFKGKHILVMIDAFSKYIWAHVMNNDTTTMKTLAILYSWFVDRGFPSTLVSDNGPQLTAKEFSDKMVKWGIKHVFTPPYHPASNGLAEKAVGMI